MDSKRKTEKIIEILEGKKAKDIRIIDVSGVTTLADFFIICHGTSTTHIRTLSDEVREKMTEAGVEFSHMEGYDSARWVLLDYKDVIVHIFHEEERKLYSLERLWGDGILMKADYTRL